MFQGKSTTLFFNQIWRFSENVHLNQWSIPFLMRVLAAFVYFYQWYMKVSKKGGTPKSSASIILFLDFPLWTYCGVPWYHHFRKFQKMTCASPPQQRRKMPAECSAAGGIASSAWFAKKMVGLQQNMETFSNQKYCFNMVDELCKFVILTEKTRDQSQPKHWF